MCAYKLLVIAPSKCRHPVHDSIHSILINVLGRNQVVDVKYTSYVAHTAALLKIPFFILEDVSLSLKIMSHANKEKAVAVLAFQGYFPITSIVSRLIGLKFLLLVGGSSFKASLYSSSSFIGRILAFSHILLQRVCHIVASDILITSKSIVKWVGLEKCCSKISIIQRHFVNFNLFDISKEIDKRENLVGYIGRLKKEKGILSFIKAIPNTLQVKKDITFLIGGDGTLSNKIKEYLDERNLQDRVKIVGWIPHEELPNYLNELKLFVLPSYTEGLPDAMLEAMACGTPVLATPVGAIPDIIKERETVFLLKSNAPKHIAERIIELLDNPELLEKVSINAYRYVRENFSYEEALNASRKIFSELGLSILTMYHSLSENLKKTSF